ncbi:MAG: menaquinol-cytochrome C reductase [Symbiobacterium sp.]|mgnify:CR=1 FL=1|uniref:menaquinol-cytochrome C reductase n=1 Tax=Symbiobacterium sp. TaxID=1971213 RepID=UPI003464A3A8
MAEQTEKYQQTGPKVSPGQKEELVYTWPFLVSIEAIMAVTMILALALMATFVDAPLLDMANPDETPNPAKAPWYFLGLQELLLHMDPALAGVIVPGACLVLLATIPYIDRDRRGTGIWFSTKKGVPITVFSAVYTAVIEIALVLVDEVLRVSGMEEGSHGVSATVTWLLTEKAGFATEAVSWIGSIFIPLCLMIGIPWVLAAIVRRRYQANTREIMIALYTFFFTSFLVLSGIGTFFRGESMRLVWPWELHAPH